MNYDESVSNDFVWSQGGKNVQLSESRYRRLDDHLRGDRSQCHVGERLKAVEPYLQGEEMFLANYGDGLSDVPLPAMVETFRQSNAVASLHAGATHSEFRHCQRGTRWTGDGTMCPLDAHATFGSTVVSS